MMRSPLAVVKITGLNFEWIIGTIATSKNASVHRGFFSRCIFVIPLGSTSVAETTY